jgi:hypothetical protein
METEEQIVYSIIETVTKGHLTDDNKINERLVRGFLQIYRATAIAKQSLSGLTITDECFQYLGEVPFKYLKPKHYISDLPKILLLQHNFGVRFEVEGENIPVLNSEEFQLSFGNLVNKRLPKAKMVNNKPVIYTGEYVVVDGQQFPKENHVISNLKQQMISSNNGFINVEVYAILDNPSKAPDYDWTQDPYPCPSELVEEIKTKILAKEYNIILNVNTDKVSDSNDNEQEPNRTKPQQ